MKMGADRFDAVVNIQGDEPFIVPDQIDELCTALIQAPGGIATLAQVVTDDRDLDDPGEVLITTTLKTQDRYLAGSADMYYIERADAALYQPGLPPPAPAPLRTWKVVAP